MRTAGDAQSPSRITGRKCYFATAFVAAVLSTSGCASFPVNPPLGAIDPGRGYRLATVVPPDAAADETLFVVSLSGGGTRAAALDYGVLAALDRVPAGDGKTLLDEVDLMTGSSSSGLVSAYYALRGKDVFLADFPAEVLYRNIQGDLLRKIASPASWPSLLSRRFSRSDLADRYFDRQIFRGATFGSLPARRPFVLINATDISRGSQFTFTQGAFDALCSDLDGVSLSRAVTASLAFTGGFSPVTFRNYPKSTCGYRRPAWIDAGLADPLGDVRAHDRATAWASYEDEARPWVHLLDSGISDNLGARAASLPFTVRGEPWSVLDRVESGAVRRLVVVLVDARSQGEPKIDRRARAPGLGAAIGASAGSPMSSVSSDTVAFVQRYLAEIQGCTTYFIYLRFEAEPDPETRDWLNHLPTTLALPRPTIDRIVAAAPRLLAASPDYQRLLSDLEADSRGFP
jgi:NTE family protein